MEKPDCTLCQKIYGDEAPPCFECFPPLLIENVLPNKILQLALSQIGVNNASVFQIIERYVSEFQDQEQCFDLIFEAGQEIKAHISKQQAAAKQAQSSGNQKYLH